MKPKMTPNTRTGFWFYLRMVCGSNEWRGFDATSSALMNGWRRFPSVARRPSGLGRGQLGAEGWNAVGICGCGRRCAGGTIEISQTRSVWLSRNRIHVPEGRWKCCANVPPSFQDEMIFWARYQPQCGWLISDCPFGTKRSAVRSAIGWGECPHEAGRTRKDGSTTAREDARPTENAARLVMIPPPIIQRILFPVILFLGTLLGKYHGTNWPGCPARCTGV